MEENKVEVSEEIKAKRKMFKSLFSCIENSDISEAENVLMDIISTIDTAYDKLRASKLVGEMEVEYKELPLPETATEEEKTKYASNVVVINEALKMLKEVSVKDAADWSQAILNSIDHHKYKKLKDLTVKDLDIVLLD